MSYATLPGQIAHDSREPEDDPFFEDTEILERSVEMLLKASSALCRNVPRPAEAKGLVEDVIRELQKIGGAS